MTHGSEFSIMSTLLLVLYHHHNLSLSLIGHISTSQPIHDGGEDKDVSTCQMMSQSASIYMCLWICLFVPWSNSFCISLCLRFLCLAVCISILLYLSKLLSQCPHAFSHALCVQVSNISINLSFACLLHDSCNSLSLPLSQVCRSYFHVAAHDSQWRDIYAVSNCLRQ